MAVACPVDLDTRQLRREIQSIYARVATEPSGAFHFHDLAKPSIHVSTASRTYSIVMPRPLASDLFGSIDDLHGIAQSFVQRKRTSPDHLREKLAFD